MSLYAGGLLLQDGTTSKHNIEFALEGYHRAVADIIAEDSEILPQGRMVFYRYQISVYL